MTVPDSPAPRSRMCGRWCDQSPTVNRAVEIAQGGETAGLKAEFSGFGFPVGNRGARHSQLPGEGTATEAESFPQTTDGGTGGAKQWCLFGRRLCGSPGRALSG